MPAPSSAAAWSRLLATLFCLLLSVCGITIAAHTPPLLSPDEPAHVVRAYTLSSGEWLLHNPPAQSSSAWVDPALANFLQLHRLRNRVAVGRDLALAPAPIELAQAGKDALGATTGLTSLQAPGSAVYPPLIYLPQGLALKVGRWLRLPVASAYSLARLAALLASAMVLWLAFRLRAPNPLSLALLALPMSVFQLASAALDGFATSLAVLAISLYQVLPVAPARSRARFHGALVLTVLVLVPARLHLWPLLVFPLLSARQLKRQWAWLLSLGALSAVLAWVVALSRLTVDLRRAGVGDSPLHTAVSLMQHPLALVAVLTRTLTDPSQLWFYSRSFIGILGWLHLPLQPPQAYGILACLLLTALLLAVAWAWRGPRDLFSCERFLLWALAGLSSISVFVLLLLAWTPHPLQALVVEGVQGRYFLIPALLAATALAAPQPQLACLPALLVTYGFGTLVLLTSTVLSLQVL